MVTAAFLFLPAVATEAASTGPIVDQACTDVSSTAFGGTHTQTFTPGLKQLKQVEIHTVRSGSHLEWLEIRRSEQTLASWGPTSDAGWVTFALPTDQALEITPGETLTIALKTASIANYRWTVCSHGYPGGEADFDGTRDFAFRIYAPQDTTPPTTPAVAAEPTTIGSLFTDTPADVTWAAEIALGADDVFPNQDVTVEVVDVDKDKVVRTETLVDLAEHATHTWTWDGDDNAGNPAPTGDYRFEVTTCDRVPAGNGTPNCAPNSASDTFTFIGSPT